MSWVEIRCMCFMQCCDLTPTTEATLRPSSIDTETMSRARFFGDILRQVFRESRSWGEVESWAKVLSSPSVLNSPASS